MTAKTQIAFLLNPVSTAAITPLPLHSTATSAFDSCASAARIHNHTRSFYPYHHDNAPLSPVIVATTRDASSPIASGTLFSSPLLLLGACIAPLEKIATTNKRSRVDSVRVSKRTCAAVASVFAPLSDSNSSCGSSASEREDNDDDDAYEELEDDATNAADANVAPATTTAAKATASGKSVRKTRTPPCQVDGCTNIAVSRGCCVRHGGGSRCTIAGCTNRAKLHKRCFQHGGFKTCSTDGCTKKAKRYGHCWSHGGGRICEIPACAKVSTQGGLCWAHGGGNRCQLDGCSRRSYQKYGYYCVDHANLNTTAEQQTQEQAHV